MTLFTIILVYIILGVLFSWAYSKIIIWAVNNQVVKISKKFLLILSYLYFTIMWPIVLLGILRRDIKKSENDIINISNKNK